MVEWVGGRGVGVRTSPKKYYKIKKKIEHKKSLKDSKTIKGS